MARRFGVALTCWLASLADFIAEVSVNPPLRRSARTVTTRGKTGNTITTVTYAYDAKKRLTREVVSGGSTTTWTAWDRAGWPTAGGTTVKGGLTTMATITYDDNARSFARTEGRPGQTITCTMVFDANGNPASTTCAGAAGAGSKTTIRTLATEKVCG